MRQKRQAENISLFILSACSILLCSGGRDGYRRRFLHLVTILCMHLESHIFNDDSATSRLNASCKLKKLYGRYTYLARHLSFCFNFVFYIVPFFHAINRNRPASCDTIKFFLPPLLIVLFFSTKFDFTVLFSVFFRKFIW